MPATKTIVKTAHVTNEDLSEKFYVTGGAIRCVYKVRFDIGDTESTDMLCSDKLTAGELSSLQSNLIKLRDAGNTDLGIVIT
jgi:hypothetical protein